MEWQPIETAPKDGTEVLAWGEREGFFVAFYLPKRKSWLWTAHELHGDETIRPTHWMPLPLSPEWEN